MHETEQIADVQRLCEFLESLAHRFGRAGDDVTFLGELLPGQVGIAAARRSVLRQRAGLDRLDRAITRCIGKARIDVQAAIVEIIDMLLDRKSVV
jgi:hypothetical protein